MKLFNNNKRLYLFNKIIFSISFVMLFAVSCNNNSSDISIIKGKIQNAQNKTLQIEEIYPGFIDTVAKTKISKKGEFKIKIKINENTFHRLKLDDNNIILLKINPNEKIEINAN